MVVFFSKSSIWHVVSESSQLCQEVLQCWPSCPHFFSLHNAPSHFQKHFQICYQNKAKNHPRPICSWLCGWYRARPQAQLLCPWGSEPHKSTAASLTSGLHHGETSFWLPTPPGEQPCPCCTAWHQVKEFSCFRVPPTSYCCGCTIVGWRRARKSSRLPCLLSSFLSLEIYVFCLTSFPSWTL